ncbi:hypothetical protein BDV29DRAFT_196187 [Aspergillus leporis]|uniref:Cytochrome b5 heme-binding domain-containing protein n=1 Tax=Aspergillus leporis TaxID=41062 RepID=A0A5N5WH64_9EURO|nr:hypothetical protein BDV29DRAFT_196187 [Aspergillus leporis]
MTIVQLILVCLFIVLIYNRFRRKALTAPIQDLLNLNGDGGKPIYLAVRGRVFDGGLYQNFAGRDASRGLALQSFDEETLTKDLKGPLDDLQDLNTDQLVNLESWEKRFMDKYPVVGRLVAEDDLRLQHL